MSTMSDFHGEDRQLLSHEETLILLEKAQNGDSDAKDILVRRNIALVKSLVKKFLNRGYEYEDLFQLGSIGLIKAIHNYEPKYNVRFSTYAVPMIIGEIKRFIRDDGIIKVSRSLKEVANKARITKEIMTKELGHEPTINELSDRLKIPCEDLVMAIEAGYTPESLYSTVGDGDSAQMLLIDKIDSESNHNEMDLIDKIALRQVVDELNPREKQIILLRY